MENLRTHLDITIETATNHFNESHRLGSTVIGFSDKGHYFVPLYWETDEEKQQAFAAVCAILQAMECDAYATMSEAWAVERKPGEYSGERPSQALDRKEVISVSVCGPDAVLSTSAVIERHSDGSVTLSDWKPAQESRPGECGLMSTFLIQPVPKTVIKHYRKRLPRLMRQLRRLH